MMEHKIVVKLSLMCMLMCLLAGGCGTGNVDANMSEQNITISVCTSFVESETGYRKEYQYDPNGKWIKEIQYTDDGEKIKVLKHEFKYDKCGNCIRIKTEIDDDNYRTIKYKYDEENRIIREDGNYVGGYSGTYVNYRTIGYDSNGNKNSDSGYEGSREVDFVYEFNDDGTPLKECVDKGWSDSYDKLFKYTDGRLEGVVYRFESMKADCGGVYSYDEAGKLISKRVDWGCPEEDPGIYTYQYNSEGKLERMTLEATDGYIEEYEYVYDENGRLIKNPEGEYEYASMTFHADLNKSPYGWTKLCEAYKPDSEPRVGEDYYYQFYMDSLTGVEDIWKWRYQSEENYTTE